MAAELDIMVADGFQVLCNFETGCGFWTQDGVPPLRRWWPTAEHYLQAGKFLDLDLQEKIRTQLDPGIAKHLGRTCGPLRADWDEVKQARLRKALWEKFWAHAAARRCLLSIPQDTRIVFGSTVDPFFGIGADGYGQNVMGEELQSLRDFLLQYSSRRQMLISIADGIGEPFEPDTVHLDMTGICPESTSRSVANILGISPDAIEDLDLVFDDGFERRPVSDFSTAKEMETFLATVDDCKLEVRILQVAVVTLWNGTDDSYLARADVSHLSSTAASVTTRLESLLPLLSYKEFSPAVTFSVDGSQEEPLVELCMDSIRRAALEGADVIISGHYSFPDTCTPLMLPPSDVESPAVVAGIHSGLSAAELSDKINGLIWGAALGDAVGLSTEFMERCEATRIYPNPAQLSPASRHEDKHRKRWIQGDWTDDTDQMIILLDAIISGHGILSPLDFARALKRWRNSGFPELGDTSGLGVGQTVNSVLEHPVFEMAPHIAADVIWRQTGRTLAANGAIMRCAAAGIGCFWDERVVEYNAATSASVTHTDPRCVSSCVCIALLLSQVLSGHGTSTLDQRIELALSTGLRAVKHLKGQDADELLRYVSVAADGLQSLELASGGIGYTFKALGAGLWAFVHADDFKEAVQAITMEAGDADSNATVAGALMGARLGFSNLPKDWISEIPEPQAQWLQQRIHSCLAMLRLA